MSKKSTLNKKQNLSQQLKTNIESQTIGIEKIALDLNSIFPLLITSNKNELEQYVSYHLFSRKFYKIINDLENLKNKNKSIENQFSAILEDREINDHISSILEPSASLYHQLDDQKNEDHNNISEPGAPLYHQDETSLIGNNHGEGEEIT